MTKISGKQNDAPDFSSANFYRRLGVPESASPEHIKLAFRQLALKYHPDKNKDDRERSEEIFKSVAEAYDTLFDPVKRKKYDSELANASAYKTRQASSQGAASSAYRRGATTSFTSPFGSFDAAPTDHGPFLRRNTDFLPDRSTEHFVQMNLDHAERIFRDAFQQNFFGNFGSFDDPFSRSFGLEDLAFRRVNSHFSNIDNAFERGGSSGSVQRSLSTSTMIINGNKVVRSKEKLVYPDGRIEEREFVGPAGNNIRDIYPPYQRSNTDRPRSIEERTAKAHGRTRNAPPYFYK